jgi:hypothetical protein
MSLPMLVAAATTNLRAGGLGGGGEGLGIGLRGVPGEGLVLELQHGAGAIGRKRSRDRVDAAARRRRCRKPPPTICASWRAAPRRR